MNVVETTQTDLDIAEGKYGDIVVFDPETSFYLRVSDGKGGIASMPELGMSLPAAFSKALDLGHEPTHWMTLGRSGVWEIPRSVTYMAAARKAAA
jgi:hypothetical protein